MNTFIIFPNTLVEDITYFNNIDLCIITEDPLFFYDKERITNFNKLKLIFHRASMRYYYDYLKSKNIKVKYIPFNNNNIYKDLKGKIYYFNPYDHLLNKRIMEECKKYKLDYEMLRNPIYIDMGIEEYKKPLFQTSFYLWQRKRLNILSNAKKSYDKENRKKLPNKIVIPKVPTHNSKYINDAVTYIQKHFPNNYGGTNLLFPVTHGSAKKWFLSFIKKRLKHFGDYQDAINNDFSNPFLFHSGSAPMLNVGLLTQDWQINMILKYGEKYKINNVEGFIRQVIGWNNFCKLYYMTVKYNLKKNYFNNKNKMNYKWWTGELGIKPVDDVIKTAFTNGYLHHIQRLMIMLNFQILCGIDYEDIYKWHMEYSCDAYDVYMIFNVYSMGYGDGGLTVTKPYISSSNYILKMSNYKRDEWCIIWDALYYRFIDINYKKLKDNYRMRFMISAYNKKTNMEIKEYIKIGNSFIKNIIE